jgi:hypothetical protein
MLPYNKPNPSEKIKLFTISLGRLKFNEETMEVIFTGGKIAFGTYCKSI